MFWEDCVSDCPFLSLVDFQASIKWRGLFCFLGTKFVIKYGSEQDFFSVRNLNKGTPPPRRRGHLYELKSSPPSNCHVWVNDDLLFRALTKGVSCPPHYLRLVVTTHDGHTTDIHGSSSVSSFYQGGILSTMSSCLRPLLWAGSIHPWWSYNDVHRSSVSSIYQAGVLSTTSSCSRSLFAAHSDHPWWSHMMILWPCHMIQQFVLTWGIGAWHTAWRSIASFYNGKGSTLGSNCTIWRNWALMQLMELCAMVFASGQQRG